MNKRILILVVLIGLVGLLAGAYVFGSQQSAQACHASKVQDVFIVDPHATPDNNESGHIVDTFTAPAFDQS